MNFIMNHWHMTVTRVAYLEPRLWNLTQADLGGTHTASEVTVSLVWCRIFRSTRRRPCNGTTENTHNPLEFWVNFNDEGKGGEEGGSSRRAACGVEHFGIWFWIGLESRRKVWKIWQPNEKGAVGRCMSHWEAEREEEQEIKQKCMKKSEPRDEIQKGKKKKKQNTKLVFLRWPRSETLILKRVKLDKLITAPAAWSRLYSALMLILICEPIRQDEHH